MELQKDINRYLMTCRARGAAENTIDSYGNNLRVFAKWVEDDRPDLETVNLDAEDIEQYTFYLMEKYSLVTCNNKLRALSAFLTYLKERGKCPKDLRIKMVKVQETDIEPFTDAQLADLYDACLLHKRFSRLRDYTFMRMLEETGIRLNECLGLRLGDVNMTNGVITLRNTKNRKLRHAYMTPIMKQEIGDYMIARERFLAERNLSCDSIWISSAAQTEGQPLSRATIQRHISEYGDLAGINIRVSPHTFRHTFARNWIMAGGDMFTLKELLGHSSLEMVLKYVKLWSKDRQNNYNKVMANRSKTSNVKQYNRRFKSNFRQQN